MSRPTVEETGADICHCKSTHKKLNSFVF
ncbi:hypothetical protein HNY73_013843 [Argiope bruennichi]|uniref:Uncharacterized protein n=1 Tax=Argiope bruennichi TaxID=94029 RepID=A0A8T0ER16_ARGBR|nr:hypothetical protein HNY73_013843 [Argiope bruennichi]